MAHVNAGFSTGIKGTVYNAFIKAFKDDFWSSIDASMKDVRPESLVVPEFPVKKQEFPFIVLNTDIGKISWAEINPPSERNDYMGVGRSNATITIDIYTGSAAQRDRMFDSVVNMLLFALTQPRHSQWIHELEYSVDWLAVRPTLNNLSVSVPPAMLGIQWEPKTPFYQASVSFDADVNYTMKPHFEEVAVIKEVDVDAEPIEH